MSDCLRHPLLDNIQLNQAQAAIVSVVAKDTIELSQYNQIGATVHEQLPKDALVIIGLTIDPELESELEIMVIATGIGLEQTAKPDPVQIVDDSYINVHDFIKRPALPLPEPAQSKFDLDKLQIPTYLRQQKPPTH
ncbi:hypothetical protein [Shewanella xiamenensis]|uniref:hypothetical protein n=1 Tax=Shewanella xiamenensis TaxID=332186 RepID=UPI002E7C4637|nr:hypothetical protein [Shewanella xiamenensis]MEE1981925.1 hypothetical protein [Shewanella xiamenensis]